MCLFLAFLLESIFVVVMVAVLCSHWYTEALGGGEGGGGGGNSLKTYSFLEI